MQEETKNCQNCKTAFVITADDFLFYEKIQVPPPTFCPECRMIRRFAFRNQYKLFKSKDAFTGAPTLTLIPPDSGIQIITPEEWFSDVWDPMEHGIDVDFSRPFLEQLFEIHQKIPQLSLNVTRMVNSPYSGNANDLKNCYLVFNAARNEDCLYGTGYYRTKDSVDNTDIYDSEYCYGNFWLKNCSKTHFSEECTQCVEVMFSKNCSSCVSCIGCVNLRNKSHCIFNEQYSKQDYEAEVEKLALHTHAGIEALKVRAHAFWKKFPKKYFQGIKNVNSTGAYITECKNVRDSYLIEGGEDLRFCQFIAQPPNKDCYDISVWGDGSELTYEYSSSGSGVYNSKFIVDCWPNIRDVEYSLHCSSASNLFGCAGLRNKEYCILNKQYSKEQYEKMVEKIKVHMSEMPYKDKQGIAYPYGEFFPIEFSWYGYNNTLAQEYFPLEKERALERGYPWYEIEKGKYEITMQAKDLPQSIDQVDESISGKVVRCENCGNAYQFQQEEINFLKREKLPLPHHCFDCRHAERISRRLPTKLYKRKCMKDGCANEFLTAHDPQGDDIVYCESCYQKEVI